MALNVSLPQDFDSRVAEMVFGPGAAGAGLAQWALGSKKLFARSETHIAEWNGSRAGWVLAPFEALRSFGWPILQKLADRSAASFLDRNCLASPILKSWREAMGVSCADVGAAAGLDAEVVEAVERRGREIPVRQITAIARCLSLDAWSIGAMPPERFDRAFVERLAILTTDAGPLPASVRLALAEAAWLVATQARLLNWMRPSAGPAFRFDGGDRLPRDPEDAWDDGARRARDLRRILRLRPDAPVPSVAAVAEGLGVPLVRMRLGEEVAGAALSIGGERGIVLNIAGLEGNPGIGRLTTGHEIAHAVLETDDQLNRLSITDRGILRRTSRLQGDPIECRAQAFAAELLLPSRVAARFYSEAGGGREALTRMMAVFGVSFAAARRQAATGVRDVGEGRDLKGEKIVLRLPKEDAPDPGADWRTAEAAVTEPTLGLEPWADGTFVRLVVAAHGSNVISSDTAAELLKVPRTDFEAAIGREPDTPASAPA